MDKKTKDLARALFDIIISFYYIELFFSVKKELDEVKIEAKEFKDADKEVSKLKTQLAKAEKDSENCNDFRKKYELTKNICLELEEQVKQYEMVIEKYEDTQEKLKKSSDEFKKKADENSSELIKNDDVEN